MSRDSVCSGYRLRANKVTQAAIRLKTTRDNLQTKSDQLESEIESLGEKVVLYSKVGELLRHLIDLMVMGHVRSIESVVTEGLRTIFVDQDLQFVAEIGQLQGKVSIDFYIQQRDGARIVKAPPTDGFGGGNANVASLLLKVLVMKRLHKWPLLVLDEMLNGVSNEYVDATGQFVHELAKSTGMSFLLVTHKPHFADHADNHYLASSLVEEEDGERMLQLRRAGSK